MQIERITPRWAGELCVVAASGPSLTPEVAMMVLAARCRVIAVNNAYRRIPTADILYAGDRDWWELYDGCPDFAGEKWTAHELRLNDKTAIADRWGIRLVAGPRQIDAPGFSLDPDRIHYGNSSGFQAINLAILLGCAPILLVGFDMRTPEPGGGPRHFHPDYPVASMNLSRYEHFIPAFNAAAAALPARIRVVNCTPRSGLRCFPMSDLAAALGVPAGVP